MISPEGRSSPAASGDFEVVGLGIMMYKWLDEQNLA